jgi:hypothetical protein
MNILKCKNGIFCFRDIQQGFYEAKIIITFAEVSTKSKQNKTVKLSFRWTLFWLSQTNKVKWKVRRKWESERERKVFCFIKWVSANWPLGYLTELLLFTLTNFKGKYRTFMICKYVAFTLNWNWILGSFR